MAKDARRLSAKQRDLLLRVLLERYETNPQALTRAVPELARLLEELVGQAKKPAEGFFELTGKEEAERKSAYLQIVDDMEKKRETVSKEAAIAALEHAAPLQEGSFEASLVLKSSTILKLVKVATGLSLEKKGGPRKCVIREGEPSRVVSLVKGVKAYRSWDKKLLSVEVDPKGLAQRAKALGFVGSGHDVKADVARLHDSYIYGEGVA